MIRNASVIINADLIFWPHVLQTRKMHCNQMLASKHTAVSIYLNGGPIKGREDSHFLKEVSSALTSHYPPAYVDVPCTQSAG